MSHLIYCKLIGFSIYNFHGRCYDNYSLYDLSVGDVDGTLEHDLEDIAYDFGPAIDLETNEDFSLFTFGGGYIYSNVIFIGDRSA